MSVRFVLDARPKQRKDSPAAKAVNKEFDSFEKAWAAFVATPHSQHPHLYRSSYGRIHMLIAYKISPKEISFSSRLVDILENPSLSPLTDA